MPSVLGSLSIKDTGQRKLSYKLTANIETMRTIRVIQIASIGGLGGLLSWSLLQAYFYGQQILGPFPLLDPFIYEGIVIGAGMGIFFKSKEDLLFDNFFALQTSIPIGVCVGLVSGFLGFMMGQSLLALPIFVPLSLVRVISWMLLGFWLSLLINFATPSSKKSYSQIVGAIGGGLLGGLFFESYQLSQTATMSSLLGLVVWGMILSLSIVVFEVYSSKAYLRVLTGKSKGKIHFMDKDKYSMGYQSHNDIILRGYTEVCDTHAHIIKNNPNYQIINVSPGGKVFVNYRFVEQQNMKNGDIIKLGSALLQFCEVS